jgi:hypothetical protein
MKIAYEASNSIEAYILKGLLETFEISAFVQGEHLHSGAGELPMNGSVRVTVHDHDFQYARKIINDWEGSDSIDDAQLSLLALNASA